MNPFEIVDDTGKIIKLGNTYFQGCIGTEEAGIHGCPDCIFTHCYKTADDQKACDRFDGFFTYCHDIIRKNNAGDKIQFKEIPSPVNSRKGKISKPIKTTHKQSELELEIISQLL
jgi:hypothetical protein